MIKTISGSNEMLNQQNVRGWASDVEKLKQNREFDGKNFVQSTTDVQRSFSDFLMDSMGQINGLQQEANLAIEKLATGQSRGLHETMLAVEKAEIAFKTMNQIRSKVIDAYKEIMKMQI